jgi:hypothetical protein
VSVVRKFFDKLDVALSRLTTASLVWTTPVRLSGLFGALVGPLLLALEEDPNLGDRQRIKGVLADVAIALIVQCRDEFGLIS